ncbi:SMP-30/gluconolactonase/LRE family protein [Streptomyces millisiae]|uniref:SMP-30/gluconolactonase/LRE family protein n=1 Tax=Streptomyces millisiae TaxID=3075542 RepID=A0ABU2LIN0_9ACTN|nr:SMP-30/gluconolactonase/LRE family protein [Streptomyces sp. DSM 44918]MDT0317345.1 SMP-30/gluconolactonase/LRE family protein [Streptomyces sp. DSM 44918]
MRSARAREDQGPSPSRRSLLGASAGLGALLGVASPLGAGQSWAAGRPAGERAASPLDDDRAAGPLLPVPRVDELARMGPHGCEGMVFDAAGRLFMSNTQGTEILLIGMDGAVTEWTRAVRAPNGHKVLADGTHLVAQMGPPGAVVWLDADGSVLRVIDRDDRGRALRAANDVAIDPRTGGAYVTDPGPFAGGLPGRVYYLPHPRAELMTVVDEGDEGVLDYPNGLALSPDGRALLVSESGRNRIIRFALPEPGRPVRPTVFARLPSQPNTWTDGEAQPDGLAFDTEGRLFVAHFGTGLVRVRDGYGRDLGSLDSRTPCITNFAFGGPDMDQLFVTAHLGTSLGDPGPAVVMRMTLPGIEGLRLLP